MDEHGSELRKARGAAHPKSRRAGESEQDSKRNPSEPCAERVSKTGTGVPLNEKATTTPQNHMAATSPLEAALQCIGGKWKGLVVVRLLNRTWRFNELLRSLGCTQRVLTNQLRELEANGIVRRVAYPEVPPRVEYSLTEMGRALRPSMQAMSDWSQQHVQGIEPDFEAMLELVS